ncbi:MAG: response regulator [Cyclobacteriaceae bacterium]|nr:response regulator [Cyclobacteriaceae bacterium HetDA_MAG_MS6]
MDRLYIVCVDDQREVLNALADDLEILNAHVEVEICESASEAKTLIEEIDANGDLLAVVISDQVMPGTSGVDFLTQLKEDGRFPKTLKILLTGLATHEDTIQAINEAGLDQYIEKPWSQEDLVIKIKKLLTLYVLRSGLDYQSFIQVLDQTTLYEGLRART